MSHDPTSLIHILRRTPRLAFERVSLVRSMPAIHWPSITSIHARLSHIGLDGIRRSIQPDLTLLARVESERAPLRQWALLVDVLPRGRLDIERVWTWPFTHATLRHELGVPTLHLVFADAGLHPTIQAAFTWEPELLPILVESLDPNAANQPLPHAAGYH